MYRRLSNLNSRSAGSKFRRLRNGSDWLGMAGRPLDVQTRDVSGQQLPVAQRPAVVSQSRHEPLIHTPLRLRSVLVRLCSLRNSVYAYCRLVEFIKASLKTQTGAFPTLVNTSARKASLCATTVPATISPVFAPFRVRRRIRPDMYQPELCPPGSSCTLLPDRQHRASLFLSSSLLWLL